MPTQKQFLDSVGLTELLDELGQYLKTTIPIVNNGTLTIQKNGTNVATFTANASTGAIANITVPTATSDLTNDSGFLGDADVSYDANTKTLIIGSFNEYTITLTGNGVSEMRNITINGESKTTSDFPMVVDEGSSLGFKHLFNSIGCIITMGGTDITSSVRTMQNEGSGSVAIPYYVYDITNITGDIVVIVNYTAGGGAN